MLDSTAGERPSPPLVAGKYRLGRELGRGGMGVVYQATHSALPLEVAIKIVLPELAQNPLVTQRLLREARCAAQITSDHVVRVIDVGQLESSGQPFIVMEYVDGEDLARVLARSGRLPLHAAVHALLEACIAVAEAHAKGIVHRDLKPSNLFLARATDGRQLIKVLDFGISKQTGGAERPVTRPNDVMGSPNYMAPEQICTPLAVDARADVWALGAILVELTTGKRAFPGDTITAVYTRVLMGEPDLPEPDSAELPNEIVAVVSRCLRKDPGERFQSVHELVAALAPVASPASTSAIRAIARFEPAALERARAGGSTATYLPSPFASAPATPSRASAVALHPVAGHARVSLAAGVGLGLAVSAAFVMAPMLGLGGAPRATGALQADAGGPEVRVLTASNEPADDPRRTGLRPGEVRTGEVKTGEVRTGEVRTGEVKADEVRTDEVRTDEVRTDEVRTDEVRTDEAHADAALATGPRALEVLAETLPVPKEHGSPPAAAPSSHSRPEPAPRETERSRATAPSLEPPPRNPWDVTTFGGRS